MSYDFNVLERCARELVEAGRVNDAIKIYIFMADGDSSLDGGYLGMKLGECYEIMGEPIVARYWYGRAIEENPEVRTSCIEARERLRSATIDDLVARETPSKSSGQS